MHHVSAGFLLIGNFRICCCRSEFVSPTTSTKFVSTSKFMSLPGFVSPQKLSPLPKLYPPPKLCPPAELRPRLSGVPAESLCPHKLPADKYTFIK